MSFSIETSPAKMRTEADEVRQLASQYNQLQGDLFNEGRQLDQTWDGDASSSFSSRLKSDEPRFQELFQVIGQYCDAVTESANEYDKTEQMIADEMKSNSIRTSG